MDINSCEYYVGREARVQALANAASDPGIAEFHREMARHYRQRIDAAAASSRL